VLVGCSGGPDSVVLADVLVRLAEAFPLKLTVASVDHGLRPEAPAEVQHVAQLAEAWGVPFRGLTLALEPGAGVPARARQARYQALEGLRRELGADVVAVGHTRDDQAETVLARLLRGSGVRGLRGIAPTREDAVVRPLIDCARSDVHAYLEAHGNGADPRVRDGRNVLVAVTDPSNHDPAFERVRLRHVTLPALRVEDAEVDRHLAELADDARDLVELVEHEGARLLAAARVPQPGVECVDVLTLRGAPRALRLEALRQLVEGALAPLGSCRRAHLLELEQAVRGGAGAHVLVGGGVSYRRVGNHLVEERTPPGRDHDRGGLRPGSEETTKLYV
jgi:tRNA(Ile)-lysidine synthase